MDFENSMTTSGHHEIHNMKLNRIKRLLSAKRWIETYDGTNIVKGYAKKYAIDIFCAIYELRRMNISISEEYEKQLKQSIETLKKYRQLKKEEKELELKCEWESDENFAKIMGYTHGGFPYGIRHDDEKINIQPDLK